MDKNNGTVMINGVVLKDGLNKFKADREIVSQSLLRISKISKGLYSGILNSDPDFIEFQKEAMEVFIKKETDKLCSDVVVGAEEQLKKLAQGIMAVKGPSYICDRRCKDVEIIPIEIESEKDDAKKSIPIQDIVQDRSDKLASMNAQEIAYLRDINKETKKILDLREKVKTKIAKKIDTKVVKNKVKKTRKNVQSKKRR